MIFFFLQILNCNNSVLYKTQKYILVLVAIDVQANNTVIYQSSDMNGQIYNKFIDP